MGKYFCGLCKLFDDDVSKINFAICIFCLFYVDVSVCLAKSSVCDFRFLNNSIIAMDVEYVGTYVVVFPSGHGMNAVKVLSIENNTLIITVCRIGGRENFFHCSKCGTASRLCFV